MSVQYNSLVHGFVCHNMDAAISSWPHDEGHVYGARRLKLFTFSRLFGKRKTSRYGRFSFYGSARFYLSYDPFNGFEEARALVGSLRREYGLDWVRAKSIVVNLTGGTTCLGWAAGQVENSLKGMSLKPTTMACIDRRSPAEQRANPYVEGEMIEIGRGEEE